MTCSPKKECIYPDGVSFRSTRTQRQDMNKEGENVQPFSFCLQSQERGRPSDQIVRQNRGSVRPLHPL